MVMIGIAEIFQRVFRTLNYSSFNGQYTFFASSVSLTTVKRVVQWWTLTRLLVSTSAEPLSEDSAKDRKRGSITAFQTFNFITASVT